MREGDFIKSINKWETFLRDSVLTEKEERLMALLFGEEVTEKDIHVLTDNIDVDTENVNYMLMLSYLGNSRGWQYFPEDIIPRLKGLHRYYHVRNSLGIPGLVKQIQLLDRAGIPVMLIKGMAMKAYYAPNAPRIMADIDLLVPQDRFKAATNVLCAMGGTLNAGSAHAVHILNGPASVDLHRWLYKTPIGDEKEIWERAIKIPFYGIEVYVPSPEDMFVHLLDTQSRNIVFREALMRRMKWLYDCRCVSLNAKGFNWEIVAHNAHELNIVNRIRIMALYFDYCFPNVIPKDFLEEELQTNGDYVEWVKKAIKCEEVLAQQNRYQQDGKLVRRILNWPRAFWYRYSHLKSELKAADPDINYFKYILQFYSVESYSQLWKMLVEKVGSVIKEKKDGRK